VLYPPQLMTLISFEKLYSKFAENIL